MVWLGSLVFTCTCWIAKDMIVPLVISRDPGNTRYRGWYSTASVFVGEVIQVLRPAFPCQKLLLAGAPPMVKSRMTRGIRGTKWQIALRQARAWFWRSAFWLRVPGSAIGPGPGGNRRGAAS